jgi:hypothetical protein
MLFVRLFTNVENEQKANDLLQEILEPIRQYILLIKKVHVEPYWKIKDQFVVECLLELDKAFGEMEKSAFLNNIAETKKFFGAPDDEYLISDQYPGHIKDGICLLNVFFNYVVEEY